MNKTLMDKDPANEVRIQIKSGEDYPYGDIVSIEFRKEPPRFLDGYSPITGPAVRANLHRESVLELIELLKQAAAEAVAREVIDE